MFAQSVALPDPLRQDGVAGLYALREAEIGQSIFMGAEDPRLIGQRRKARQRLVEIPDIAVENTPATPGEQGISAKQHSAPVVCDMVTRMPWYLEYGQVQFRRDVHGVAVRNRPIDRWNPVGGGTIDRHPIAREEPVEAVDMIIMMVCNQDRAGYNATIFQIMDHGNGVAGIDDRKRVRRRYDPDIIVAVGG